MSARLQRLRPLVSVFLVLGGFFLALVSLAAPSARPRVDAARKIAPWVAQHTASGKQAEFLVVLAEQADLQGAVTLPAKSEKGRYVRDALWTKAQASQGPILEWLRDRGVEHRPYYIVNLIWVKAGFEVASALAARPDVARVEGNPQIRSRVIPTPNEQLASAVEATASVQLGIAYVRAPEMWALGYTGEGIVIGGADTGYRWDHNALKNKYRGWNGIVADHNYNWHDSIHSGSPACGPDSPVPCDGNGHGTHTIGTTVGDDGLGNQIGMAPGAKWIGCRNMDNGGNGTPATYLECMEFFLAPYPIGGSPALGDPSKAPDVTNNSWSCVPSEGCSAETLHAGAIAQRAAGIMMVVSAGNEGNSGCWSVRYPTEIYEEVYTVGALNTGSDVIASFSSRGPVIADGSNRLKPEIAAPGSPVWSSFPATPGSYGNLSGTSMASPHVAGAVALLWSADPRLRNDVVRTSQILSNSARNIPANDCDGPNPPATPNNTYGYGRLDVKRALAAAFLDVLAVERSDGDAVVTFRALAGEAYRLQRRTGAESWQDVSAVSDITAGATGSRVFTHPGGASGAEAFYRVIIVE